MAIQEAIDLFKEDLKDGKCNEDCPECNARELAISALEKQIPKKIIENTETDREFIDYVCPNCKTTLQQKNKQAKRITIYKYKHCIDCGQLLDWGDDNV